MLRAIAEPKSRSIHEPVSPPDRTIERSPSRAFRVRMDEAGTAMFVASGDAALGGMRRHPRDRNQERRLLQPDAGQATGRFYACPRCAGDGKETISDGRRM